MFTPIYKILVNLFMEDIRKLVKKILKEMLSEGRYDTTATPYNSHADVRRNLGYNPLYSDNGGHTAHDTVSQVSTFDTNGQNFKTNGNNIVISDNKFIIYKIKNFGNDKIESTLSLFGHGAGAEKELRRAIDTINGAATRNRRSVKYRTITSETFQGTSKRTGQMSKTFWEFSLDGGNSWYILKPSPIQSMQLSKLVYRTNESKNRLTEAQDSQFSLQTLSSFKYFKQRLEYCREHLGKITGNGSSRVVFQINDQTCLKLAKNQKGIAQNEHESEWYKQSLDCFPKIFDYDDANDSWIVCEYVLPAKPEDFKHCLGITWNEFVSFIVSCYNEYDGNRSRRTFYHKMPDEQFYNLIENNDTLHGIYDYITNYQDPMGDLISIENYGMVRRYNQDLIVILDHGLSDAIWDEYYK
jgi:hypothetical protein